MPRTARQTPAGYAYHVLTAVVGGMRLFTTAQDYSTFEQILADTLKLFSLRICAYCIMPNHWHIVVWPDRDNQLSPFAQRLTVTHALRRQQHRQRRGLGHVYQGRFKSFPVQDDDHFYQVVRYVERNPVARLVADVAAWRWSSLWVDAKHGTEAQRSIVSQWPVPVPQDWLRFVRRATDRSGVGCSAQKCSKRRATWQPRLGESNRGGI